ncbi:hypothetical protein NX786_21605 [Telluria mixta]|uniref:Uncharacterized protein n=1 Tax=Telluria mixta TaxID=34071 RepID=A0ABT2C3H3_9BURK|nr:hypothetical protein [Telluria mixta]MCS0631930.1 hypothetical protein [Telluria mixta]WEM95388.1 hypothetical protein P0M04_28570 [Telluria mixta]
MKRFAIMGAVARRYWLFRFPSLPVDRSAQFAQASHLHTCSLVAAARARNKSSPEND